MKQLNFDLEPVIGTYPLVVENGKTIVELTFAYEDNKAIVYRKHNLVTEKVAEFSNPTESEMEDFFDRQGDYWTEYYIQEVNFDNVEKIFNLNLGESFMFYKTVNNIIFEIYVQKNGDRLYAACFDKECLGFKPLPKKDEYNYHLLNAKSSEIAYGTLMKETYKD